MPKQGLRTPRRTGTRSKGREDRRERLAHATAKQRIECMARRAELQCAGFTMTRRNSLARAQGTTVPADEQVKPYGLRAHRCRAMGRAHEGLERRQAPEVLRLKPGSAMAGMRRKGSRKSQPANRREPPGTRCSDRLPCGDCPSQLDRAGRGDRSAPPAATATAAGASHGWFQRNKSAISGCPGFTA
jgi:hypothetical protein